MALQPSPSLTLRPAGNMQMSCHQSSETHVSSAVLYSHQSYESGGGEHQHHAVSLDVSDPSGNAMTLLRNVESVYFKSMTSEDEKNKLMRDKVHAEDQVRRLLKDKEALTEQLKQEKLRRGTDSSLSQELVKNEMLMNNILATQQEIKARAAPTEPRTQHTAHAQHAARPPRRSPARSRPSGQRASRRPLAEDARGRLPRGAGAALPLGVAP